MKKLLILFVLLLIALAQGQPRRKVQWNDLQEAVKDSIRESGGNIDAIRNELGDTVAVYLTAFANDSLTASNGVVYSGRNFRYIEFSDTNEAKAYKPDSANTIAMLGGLSSSNTNGGGLIVYESSGSGNGITSYSVTGGGRFVRASYRTDKTIYGSWSGAISGDATADHTNLQRAINALQNGDKLIFDGGGRYLLNKNAVVQLAFNNIDSVEIILNADLYLADNTMVDATGATALMEFTDCDNIIVDGKHHELRGNTSGQSGWSGGYNAFRGGIRFLVSAQDTAHNVHIKNLKVIDHFGDAIEPKRIRNLIIEHCKVDSVGEGILISSSYHYDVNACIIGRTFNQDGIEPAQGAKYGKIRNCTFTDSADTGTRIDVFLSQHTEIYNNTAKFMSIQFDYDSTHNIYIHDNVFENFFFAWQIRAEGTYPRGDNRYIWIKDNYFGMIHDASYAMITFEGNSDYDMDVNISGNTFVIPSTVSGNNTFFSVRGKVEGVVIENNTIINKSDGIDTGIEFIDQSGTDPGHFTLNNNKFYNFDRGFYNSGVVDSATITNNEFYGAGQDSIYYNAHLWVLTPGEAIVGNNTAELILDTDDYETGGIFTPIQGLERYYITADIDSIEESYLPLGSRLIFLHDSVSATIRTVSDANNILLANDLDWRSKKYSSLEITKVRNNKWIETNRTKEFYELTYNPVDQYVVGYWKADAGKITTNVFVDTLGDQSNSLDHFHEVSATTRPRDMGEYLFFDGVDDELNLTGGTKPDASSFSYEFVVAFDSVTTTLIRDHGGAAPNVYLQFTNSPVLQLFLADDAANSTSGGLSGVLDLGRVYVISIVVDRSGDVINWYKDGKFINSTDISSITGNITPTGNLEWGEGIGGYDHFGGNLYEFRYSIGTIRSASEVKAYADYAKRQYWK